MSIVFVDREAAYPHKYKVIPEDGSDAYYVVLERADEPLTPGTPLNAETFNNLVDDYEASAAANAAAISAHTQSVDNPHRVTADQVGAVSTETFNNFTESVAAHETSTENPHRVTYDQVGAAPAGYGLGTIGVYVTDLSTLTQTGVFSYTDTAVGNPIPGYGGTVSVFASYGVVQQTALIAGYHKGITVTRTMCTATGETAFGEWEWLNPPMVPGTSYRTTERWYNGQPVYTKLVDCGTASYGKIVENAIPSGHRAIRFAGYTTTNALPFIIETVENAYSIWCGTDGRNIQIYCGSSAAGKQTYVQIWTTASV